MFVAQLIRLLFQLRDLELMFLAENLVVAAQLVKLLLQLCIFCLKSRLFLGLVGYGFPDAGQ
jgi:hypothetical protein